MHAAVVAVARAPRISRLASVAAVSIRGGERARARATLTRAASSGPMAPIVEPRATLPLTPTPNRQGERPEKSLRPAIGMTPVEFCARRIEARVGSRGQPRFPRPPWALGEIDLAFPCLSVHPADGVLPFAPNPQGRYSTL